MMYHSLSFLQQNFHVSLIGYPGSALLPALLSHPAFKPVFLSLPPATPRWAFVVAGPLKVVWQCFVVLWVLWTLPDPPEFILVQVRPASCRSAATSSDPSSTKQLTRSAPPSLDRLPSPAEPAVDPDARTRPAHVPPARVQAHHRLAQPRLLDPVPQAERDPPLRRALHLVRRPAHCPSLISAFGHWPRL